MFNKCIGVQPFAFHCKDAIELVVLDASDVALKTATAGYFYDCPSFKELGNLNVNASTDVNLEAPATATVRHIFDNENKPTVEIN